MKMEKITQTENPQLALSTEYLVLESRPLKGDKKYMEILI
jgi:hypothetical protein